MCRVLSAPSGTILGFACIGIIPSTAPINITHPINSNAGQAYRGSALRVLCAPRWRDPTAQSAFRPPTGRRDPRTAGPDVPTPASRCSAPRRSAGGRRPLARRQAVGAVVHQDGDLEALDRLDHAGAPHEVISAAPATLT